MIEDFTAAMEKMTATFSSMTDKVMRENPAWTDLPELLTEDELRMYFAFTSVMERYRSGSSRGLDRPRR